MSATDKGAMPVIDIRASGEDGGSRHGSETRQLKGQVLVRMKPADETRLLRYATHEAMSPPAVVRQALDEFFDRQVAR